MINNFENIKIVEKSLITALFIDRGSGLENMESLEINNFFDSDCRKIYEAIVNVCVRDKQPFDESSIIFELKKIDRETDWVTEIAEIVNFAPPTLDIFSLAQKIKEESQKRQLLSAICEINENSAEDKFSELCAKVLKLTEKIENNENLSKFAFLKPSEITAKKPEFYLENFIPLPKATIGMISARGGSGKSMLALQIALRLASLKIKTLVWLSEDPLAMTKTRLESMLKMLDLKINDDFLYLTDNIPPRFVVKNNRELIVASIYYDFKIACKDFQVIILDPLIAFYGGDENSNTDARFFMNLLNYFAKKTNKTIILIHHHAKLRENKQDARGASAFTDAVRAHYSIKPDENDNRFINVHIEKDNWGICQIFGNEKQIQLWPEKYVSSKERGDKKRGRPRTKYNNESNDEKINDEEF